MENQKTNHHLTALLRSSEKGWDALSGWNEGGLLVKRKKKKGHSYPVAVLLICGKYVNNNSTTGSSGILGCSKWQCQENKTNERHTFYTVGDVPCATLLCCSSFREAGHQGMQLWNGEFTVSLERQKHLGIRYLIHSHSRVTAALPVTGSMQTSQEAMSH